MDIKLITCFLFFMVLFTTNVHETNAVSSTTLNPGQNGQTSPTTLKPVPGPQVNGQSSSTIQKPVPGQQVNGQSSSTTQTPVQGQQVNGQSSSTTQKQVNGTPTPAPKQCVKGNCTATGDDESCLKTVQGKCTFAGSCTKDVTKNATHTVVTVDCGKSACPTTATTTVKPSTPSPSSTTITCCETDLCNQYQASKSEAFGLRTNIFYVLGLLIVKVCM